MAWLPAQTAVTNLTSTLTNQTKQVPTLHLCPLLLCCRQAPDFSCFMFPDTTFLPPDSLQPVIPPTPIDSQPIYSQPIYSTDLLSTDTLATNLLATHLLATHLLANHLQFTRKPFTRNPFTRNLLATNLPTNDVPVHVHVIALLHRPQMCRSRRPRPPWLGLATLP